RTPEGLVIEADSIVLKPGMTAARGDARVRTTAAIDPVPPVNAAEAPPYRPDIEEPPIVPEDRCEGTPHPAACCPGDPEACSYRTLAPPPAPEPAAGVPETRPVEAGEDRGAWRLSLPAAIRIARANAGAQGSAGPL